jgi:hypothetical protein
MVMKCVSFQSATCVRNNFTQIIIETPVNLYAECPLFLPDFNKKNGLHQRMSVKFSNLKMSLEIIIRVIHSKSTLSTAAKALEGIL